jgi:predicted unusual protein kinase regulating ubiquinone biosynthesis (AarF/ABC1/UbiB family)
MLRARYRRIVIFFARILINLAIWDILMPRLGMRKWSKQTRPQRLKRSAAAFRSLAIQMGGVLIKVGQFLSTRVDVLPVEVTAELSGLQDEVPPVPFEAIRKVAEDEFEASLEIKFFEFDPTPLAAASLGQAHCAKIQLPRKTTAKTSVEDRFYSVVVKVQRPDIERIIATDLAALRTVGDWLRRYKPIRRRVDIPALLAEFTRILYEEIDYLAEGRNAEMFAENFGDQPGVRVPHVVWSHTTKRVLTLENVLAIKITDYIAISTAGIERGEVASRLLDTYLKQIFEDGFFHADPHPGNLFVDPLIKIKKDLSSSAQTYVPWQLTFIDFGMVGRVPPNLRQGLREMLIGVGTQDAARVVKSYQMLGVLLPSADLSLLERAEAKLFDRFWGKNMSELQNISVEEMRAFTDEFRELIYTLPFQVPQDIIFLARTVGILSGMCTGLDPTFNLWDHLAPYAQKMIAEEARGGAEVWLTEAGALMRTLISIPHKMDSILLKMDRGEIAVRAPEIGRQVTQLERALRQITAGILFAALLLGGIQLYLAGESVWSIPLFTGAFICLLWVLIMGRNSRY